MKDVNDKMERLTFGKFKKSNSKNNSTIMGNSMVRKNIVSIFSPLVLNNIKQTNQI